MNAHVAKLYKRYAKHEGLSKTLYRRIKKAHTRTSLAKRAASIKFIKEQLAPEPVAA